MIGRAEEPTSKEAIWGDIRSLIRFVKYNYPNHLLILGIFLFSFFFFLSFFFNFNL